MCIQYVHMWCYFIYIIPCSPIPSCMWEALQTVWAGCYSAHRHSKWINCTLQCSTLRTQRGRKTAKNTLYTTQTHGGAYRWTCTHINISTLQLHTVSIWYPNTSWDFSFPFAHWCNRITADKHANKTNHTLGIKQNSHRSGTVWIKWLCVLECRVPGWSCPAVWGRLSVLESLCPQLWWTGPVWTSRCAGWSRSRLLPSSCGRDEAAGRLSPPAHKPEERKSNILLSLYYCTQTMKWYHFSLVPMGVIKWMNCKE